ncbi:hypothetical protein SADUNF_Sadunf18G0082500 [Salix dunnii]|uniref:Uncharacterized protein n=1 Tax=Salix dunnii TaxID=1413687 RepID=A0A835J634_9ROSI|nr:hypothetical protein SADUNF_Sadunf18G0082500 [Salix dunnii]
MGVLRQASASCILQSRIPCSLPHKKHTSTLFASCPHLLTWPHYVLDRSLTVVASQWLCSQAKALMSSASLHHRIPSLYLFRIGHGSPSRAYLRGYRELEEKTGVLNIKLSLIGFALHGMIGFSSSWCCGRNMVRDAGAVTWGIEACVAFVMRIFVKQIGVLGLSGGSNTDYLAFCALIPCASMEQIKEITDLIAANGGTYLQSSPTVQEKQKQRQESVRSDLRQIREALIFRGNVTLCFLSFVFWVACGMSFV